MSGPDWVGVGIWVLQIALVIVLTKGAKRR